MARTVLGQHASRRSTTGQPGVAPGGTMGGKPNAKVGRRPGARPVNVGSEMYLWVLVIVEALLVGILRKQFRRHHGG